MQTKIYIFEHISLSSSRMRNISDKRCIGNKNKFYVQEPFFENHAVYTTVWKKYDRNGRATDNNIIRRTRIECWISDAKNIHSESVIFIASPLQEWLQARASI